MVERASSSPRRADSLSRERIVDAAIELLDHSGEAGLTFRALSDRLATGPGALYWHIGSRSELLLAACDAVVARTVDGISDGTTTGASPEAAIRALALGMFDAIDAHPWVGAALTRAPGQLPVVRVLDSLGQQVRALGVEAATQWGAVSALLHYILGVGGQNAANGQLARERGLDRDDFLETVSAAWSQLDPEVYPFAQGAAGDVRAHDDRADFVAGIDLILRGIALPRRG